MSTHPGFSSRSTSSDITQLPARDEAAMTEFQPEEGFSNSEPAAHAPDDVRPEVSDPDILAAGYSNDRAVGKVVEGDGVEDKKVPRPRKKTSS